MNVVINVVPFVLGNQHKCKYKEVISIVMEWDCFD